MCGIVGFSGSADALPVLVNGLKRLEYRGYDSAGIAVFDSGKIKVVKRSGYGHHPHGLEVDEQQQFVDFFNGKRGGHGILQGI